ncbi:MAG TPA: alpha/beta fold hydrolase [Thermomicrobiales bacterium]|nr:alpha/beta fold hydrolase [Thermomicrobiales bacterium]
MQHSKHLIYVISGVLLLASALAARDIQPARAYEATAEAPSSVGKTPVGAQVDWVLEQFNGGSETLTEAEFATHFTPEFLAAFPVSLLDLLRQTTAQYAPVVSSGYAFPPTATGAVVLVDLATGEHAAIYLTVEDAPPHRITRLDLSEPPAEPTAAGRRVSIGERSLYLDCQGTGSPTVVLEGGIATDWAQVQPDVAASTRVCSYDRPDSPGSRSDPTPQRTAQQVVDDLRALLVAAGEAGPYVLVGHSMGGLYVQLFAYEHPQDVAGLVLVDPTPEDFSQRLGEIAAALGTPVPAIAPVLSADEISFQQMRDARASGTLRPMPLIVLTHGRPDDPSDRPPGWPIAEEERIWLELHGAIAALVPGGRHIIAEQSGHDIHQEQPAIVIGAILNVVGAVRDPDS